MNHMRSVMSHTVAVLLLLAGMAQQASAQIAGCADIQLHPRKIAANAEVHLVLESVGTLTPPTGMSKEDFARNLVIDASNVFNLNKVDNISFLFATSGEPPSPDHVQVGIIFGGTGSGEEVANWSDYNNNQNNENVDNGAIRIFTDKVCSWGLCYEPSHPRYAAAIREMIQHEIFHALGASHSSGNNVMLGFVGINNSNNPNPNIGCIINRLNTLRVSGFPPLDPYPPACYPRPK